MRKSVPIKEHSRSFPSAYYFDGGQEVTANQQYNSENIQEIDFAPLFQVGASIRSIHPDATMGSGLSTHAYTSTEADELVAAHDNLVADINNGEGIAQIQSDLQNYYSVQETDRAYASLAYQVAGNVGYNGQVPNKELEQALGDTQYGPKELGVAEQLALQDYSLITHDGTLDPFAGDTLYVPTIGGDDLIHNVVFNSYPGLTDGLTVWGGAPSALINQNWIGVTAQPWELQDASQQTSFISLSESQLGISTLNLLAAGILTDNYNQQNAFSNAVAEVGDLPVLSGILFSIYGQASLANANAQLQSYGVTLSAPSGYTVQANVNIQSVDAAIGSAFGSGTIMSDTLQFVGSTGLLDNYQLTSGGNQYDVFGNSLTFGAPNGASTNIYGSNETASENSGNITLYPSDATLNLSGIGNSFTTMGDGVQVNLGVNATGTANFLEGGTLNTSNNNTYSVNGTEININVDCVLDNLTASNDLFNVSANSQAILNGVGNAITTSIDDTLTLAGAGSDTVMDYGNGNVLIGSGDTFDLSSSQTSTSITGTTDTVNASAGDTSTLFGTGFNYDGISGCEVVLSGSAGVTLGNAGDTVMDYGNGNVLKGSGDTFDLSSSQTSTSITGTTDTVNASAGDTSTLFGTGFNYDGTSGCEVVLSGSAGVTLGNAGDTVMDYGNGNVLKGSGDTFNLSSSQTSTSITGTTDTVNASAGDTSTLSGTGFNYNGNSGCEVVLSGSAGVTLGNAGDTVMDYGNGNVLKGSGDTFDLSSSQTSTSITGTTDTVNASAGDTSTLFGTGFNYDGTSGCEVVLSGSAGVTLGNAGDTVMDYGNGNVLKGSGDTFDLSSSQTSTSITGTTDTVNASAGDTSTLFGTGFNYDGTSGCEVVLSGSAGVTLGNAGDTVMDYGNGNVLKGSGDTFDLSSSQTSTSITGTTDTVNASAGDTSTLFGTGFNYDGTSGCEVVLSGSAGVTLGNAGDTVMDYGNGNVLKGSGDTFDLSSSQTSTSITGTTDTVNASAGDTSTLFGTGFNYDGTSGCEVVLSGSAGVTLGNAGDTVMDYGNGNVLKGSGDTFDLSSSQTSTSITGTTDTVNASAGDTSTLFGTGFNYDGTSGCEVVLSGSAGVTLGNAGDTVMDYGNGNVLKGSGDTFDLSSSQTSTSITGTTDTVNASAGDTSTLFGTGFNYDGTSGDTVNLGSNDINTTVAGSSDTINTSSGDSFNVQSSAGDTINLSSGNYVGLLGGSGDVVNGTNASINSIANTNFTVTGAGDTVGFLGSGDTVTTTQAGDTVSLATNITNATVIGGSNNVDLSAGDTVTLQSTYAGLNSNTVSLGNLLQATITQNDTTYNDSSELEINPTNLIYSQTNYYSQLNDSGSLTGTATTFNSGGSQILVNNPTNATYDTSATETFTGAFSSGQIESLTGYMSNGQHYTDSVIYQSGSFAGLDQSIFGQTGSLLGVDDFNAYGDLTASNGTVDAEFTFDFALSDVTSGDGDNALGATHSNGVGASAPLALSFQNAFHFATGHS